MAAVELAKPTGRPCPIASALELVGERWSLLVVHELLLGASKFGEIVSGTGAPATDLQHDSDRWNKSVSSPAPHTKRRPHGSSID